MKTCIMKLNFYKKNPKRILGYIMAFAMVLFGFNNSYSQITNVGSAFSPDTLTVTVGDTVTFNLGLIHLETLMYRNI